MRKALFLITILITTILTAQAQRTIYHTITPPDEESGFVLKVPYTYDFIKCSFSNNGIYEANLIFKVAEEKARASEYKYYGETYDLRDFEDIFDVPDIIERMLTAAAHDVTVPLYYGNTLMGNLGFAVYGRREKSILDDCKQSLNLPSLSKSPEMETRIYESTYKDLSVIDIDKFNLGKLEISYNEFNTRSWQIDKLIREDKSKEEKYKLLIKEADNLHKNGDYSTSINIYNEAIELNKENKFGSNTHANNRIKDALAKQEAESNIEIPQLVYDYDSEEEDNYNSKSAEENNYNSKKKPQVYGVDYDVWPLLSEDEKNGLKELAKKEQEKAEAKLREWDEWIEGKDKREREGQIAREKHARWTQKLRDDTEKTYTATKKYLDKEISKEELDKELNDIKQSSSDTYSSSSTSSPQLSDDDIEAILFVAGELGSAIIKPVKNNKIKLSYNLHTFNESNFIPASDYGQEISLSILFKRKRGVHFSVGTRGDIFSDFQTATFSANIIQRLGRANKLDLIGGVKYYTKLVQYTDNGQKDFSLVSPQIGLSFNIWHLSINGFGDYNIENKLFGYSLGIGINIF